MKTGDLVKFNHRNHKRTNMTGLILLKKEVCGVNTVSVLWETGEIIDEWTTYLLDIMMTDD